LKLDTPVEQRQTDKEKYVEKFLPYSVNFPEDLDVAFSFFDAMYDGVKTLGDEIGDADKKAWDTAKSYLSKRR
jgi:hypothetical protein